MLSHLAAPVVVGGAGSGASAVPAGAAVAPAPQQGSLRPPAPWKEALPAPPAPAASMAMAPAVSAARGSASAAAAPKPPPGGPALWAAEEGWMGAGSGTAKEARPAAHAAQLRLARAMLGRLMELARAMEDADEALVEADRRAALSLVALLEPVPIQSLRAVRAAPVEMSVAQSAKNAATAAVHVGRSEELAITASAFSAVPPPSSGRAEAAPRARCPTQYRAGDRVDVLMDAEIEPGWTRERGWWSGRVDKVFPTNDARAPRYQIAFDDGDVQDCRGTVRRPRTGARAVMDPAGTTEAQLRSQFESERALHEMRVLAEAILLCAWGIGLRPGCRAWRIRHARATPIVIAAVDRVGREVAVAFRRESPAAAREGEVPPAGLAGPADSVGRAGPADSFGPARPPALGLADCEFLAPSLDPARLARGDAASLSIVPFMGDALDASVDEAAALRAIRRAFGGPIPFIVA